MGTTNVAAGQPSRLKFDRLLTCMVKVEFVVLLPISCCICEFLRREIERNFNTSLSNAAHEVYRIICNYTNRLDNVGTIAKTISYFACKSIF